MSGISITSSKEVYDPDMLQRLSDKTRHADGTPSTNFMDVEQVAAFLDKAARAADEHARSLIASGEMNVDGSSNRVKSAQEVNDDHRRTISRVQENITILQGVKDFLPKGHNESAAYVESFKKLVETAKTTLEQTAKFAADRQGLSGQLFTIDDDGSYKVGAFVLTTLSTEGVLQTGSKGDTKIFNSDGKTTTYTPPSVNGPAEPPLDVRV